MNRLNYNIKKFDVLLGYVGYGLRFFSNLILLPFILVELTSSEYAIWMVFIALNSFVILFDMGYGVVITRYTIYANSGLDIDDVRKDFITKGTKLPNYYFLFQVMIGARKIYNNLSKIVSIILILLIPYILYISSTGTDQRDILIAWIIYSISIVINFVIMADSNIVKGLGLIRKLHIITITNLLITLIVKIILLFLGFSILGLAIGSLMGTLLLVIQYKIITSRLVKDKYQIFLEAKNDISNFKDIIITINKKSRGIGAVLISNFLQNQFLIILLPFFFSLQLIAQYGVTIQLITIIGSLASIIFSTYQSKLANLIVTQQKESLKHHYLLTNSIFIYMFIFGSVLILFSAEYVMSLLNSSVVLLPKQIVLLLTFQIFLFSSIQRAINLISYTNSQAFVRPLTYSSILIIVAQFIIMLISPNLMLVY